MLHDIINEQGHCLDIIKNMIFREKMNIVRMFS